MALQNAVHVFLAHTARKCMFLTLDPTKAPDYPASSTNFDSRCYKMRNHPISWHTKVAVAELNFPICN